MKMGKKLLVLLIVSLMMFSLASCGNKDAENTNSSAGTADNTGSPAGDSSPSSNSGSNSNTSPASSEPPAVGGAISGKDTIKIAVTGDKGTFDPCATNDLDIYPAISTMIYEPLWVYTSTGDIKYILATGYDWIDDYTMHVHIREGVTFAGGESFDATDALFSLVRFKHREGQPDAFGQLSEELSSVVDQYTIELVFTEININIPEMIPGYPMLKAGTPSETIATTMNGTGPYELTDYIVNSYMNLSLRDGYWGTPPPTKNFEFIQLKEDAQRVNALQTGEVDVANVPFQDVEFVQSLPGISLDVLPSVLQPTVYFNISPYSVFNENVDARLAVAHAIDRDAIAKLVYYGYTPRAIMPASADCEDIDDRFRNKGYYADDYYNPELARELAESSGLVNETVLLINNGAAPVVLMCELIQANLKAIDVTVEVNNLDMGSWTQHLFDETKYDMCIDSNIAMNRAIAGAFRWSLVNMAAGSYQNYDWPGHDRAFEILAEILTIYDVNERIALNYEVFEMVMDQCFWLCTVDMVSTTAISSDLRGDAKNMGGAFWYWGNLYWD